MSNILYDKISNELIQIYKDKYERLTESYNNEYDKLTRQYNETVDKITKKYENDCKIAKKKFEEDCGKLTVEENILKDNLDNKVTQTKEKLENFLSESYKIIKVNERINKGIKSMKKNDEKNKSIFFSKEKFIYYT